MDQSLKSLNRRSFLSYSLLGIGALPFLSGCGSGSGNSNSTTALGPLSPDITRQIDQIITDQMAAMSLPSVALTVWIPSQGQYTVAKGKANLSTGEARTADSPFRIASISKTFTATAIYLLADQGQLSTTDKIAKWYPDFPRASEISIDNLLRMRSGIIDSAGEPFVAEYFDNPTINLSPEDMIVRAAALNRVGGQTVSDAPDTATVYTNVNFQFLQRIAEKVSGQPLQDFLRDKIAGPLGLSGTYYAIGTSLPGPNRGYSADLAGNLTDKTVINPAPAGGAGAVVSTLSDLRTYVRALGRGDLLRSATQADRLRSQTLAGNPDFVQYGGGITKLGKFIGHNGTIFGFSSEAWYLPEKDAVIVLNVNRLDEDDASKSTELFLLLTKLLFPGLTNW